ncbi:deoxycytidylate deaminase, partial [Enterobacter hormaechei]|nr:deoxycytidylate deaminase [Enterobacter hormaechei]
ISELKGVGYKVCHIRLSDLIADTQGDKAREIKSLTGFERYKVLQDLGDQLRNTDKNNMTVVAEMAIREIVTLRNAEFKDETTKGGLAKTKKKVAYVIDQLKNPAEVELFRTVYRNNFYLIGLLRNKEERVQNLRDEPMSLEQANILMERDRSSKDVNGKSVDSGQQVEKTLYLADYFIKNIDQVADINASVGRFLKLIHGVGNLTPTHDETGIFTAHSASFRSACLSRQVGSCIMDDNGNILATGCNDVPKAGGGLYTSNTNTDMRCYNRSTCFNDKHKDILCKEIEVLLNKLNVESSATIAKK